MTKRKTTTITNADATTEEEERFVTEAEVEQVEETAVTDPVPEEVEPPAPEEPAPPQKQTPIKESKQAVSPGTLVWVRLDGGETAVVGNQAVIRGEAVRVQYQHYTQAKSVHPGKFSIKLPGADSFVME